MDQATRAKKLRRQMRWEERKCLALAGVIFMLQQICGDRGLVHDWLQSRMGRFIEIAIAFIFCRAAPKLKSKAACGFADPRQSHTFFDVRSLIGSDLRRAFKAKTVLERLGKLRRALENREHLIARFARRLRKGLSRIASAHTRAPLEAAADACFALMLNAACALLCGGIAPTDTS